MRYLKSYKLFERVSKETKLFEDVNVDRGNLQRLKDHFSPFLDDMKSRTEQTLNESRFQEFRELLSNIKDLSLEFEDNDCQCKIFPEDEIKLNIISLKSSGHLGSITQPFYLEIYVFKLVSSNVSSWVDYETGYKVQQYSLPDWFIRSCKEIESYMQSEGFTTKPSIFDFNRYALDWENLSSIDELAEQEGLIYKVRLEFLPI